MVTSFSLDIVSFSSFLQNGQSTSEKTAILRLPSPLSSLIAFLKGRLSKSTLFSSSSLAEVRSIFVFGSTNLPSTIKKLKSSSL